MALITTFVPSVAGTAPTYGAAAAADTVTPGQGYWLVIKNGSGSPMTCTLTTPGNNVFGDAVADKVYTIAAGGESWIPVIKEYADPTTGTVALTWSSTTTVTRALVKF